MSHPKYFNKEKAKIENANRKKEIEQKLYKHFNSMKIFSKIDKLVELDDYNSYFTDQIDSKTRMLNISNIECDNYIKDLLANPNIDVIKKEILLKIQKKIIKTQNMNMDENKDILLEQIDNLNFDLKKIQLENNEIEDIIMMNHIDEWYYNNIMLKKYSIEKQDIEKEIDIVEQTSDSSKHYPKEFDSVIEIVKKKEQEGKEYKLIQDIDILLKSLKETVSTVICMSTPLNNQIKKEEIKEKRKLVINAHEDVADIYHSISGR